MLRHMAENGRKLQEERMNREEEEPSGKKTGDHFMDIRKKQMEEYDLAENLARGHRKHHHDDD